MEFFVVDNNRFAIYHQSWGVNHDQGAIPARTCPHHSPQAKIPDFIIIRSLDVSKVSTSVSPHFRDAEKKKRDPPTSRFVTPWSTLRLSFILSSAMWRDSEQGEVGGLYFFGLFEFAVCIAFEVDLEHPCEGKTFYWNMRPGWRCNRKGTGPVKSFNWLKALFEIYTFFHSSEFGVVAWVVEPHACQCDGCEIEHTRAAGKLGSWSV